jgi:hypothetical protein
MPISLACSGDAIIADGLDCPYEQGLMASVECTPVAVGVVLCMMLVSKALVGGQIDMCLACGLLICPALLAAPVADVMYVKLS